MFFIFSSALCYCTAVLKMKNIRKKSKKKIFQKFKKKSELNAQANPQLEFERNPSIKFRDNCDMDGRTTDKLRFHELC